MAFAGVELPENLGQSPPAPAAPETTQPADAAPEGASPENDFSSEAPDTDGTREAKALTDLDKLDRFRFEGKEWSREDFRKAYLRQQDYTRKTQEIAQSRKELEETRKYVDNFAYDLRAVQQDRSRWKEFERLYPKEFVERAREILRFQPQEPGNPQQTGSHLDLHPDVKEKLDTIESEFQTIKQEREAQAIEQINSWLDNQFETLGKKYDFANPELVNARAEMHSRNGVQITEKVLEKLFKASHEETKANWEKRYKSLVDKQLKTGKEGRDMGAGGGVPTEGPKKFKTIKEATAGFLRDIDARR